MARSNKHERAAQPHATVIGAGKFGHAIAEILSGNGTRTELITRSESRLAQIRQQLARLSSFLSAHKLGDVPLGECVFLALPSAELPAVVSKLAENSDNASKAYVSLSKGLTPPDGETPYELLTRHFGDERSAVVSGPSLASELPVPGAHLVVASLNNTLAATVASMLRGETLDCVPSNDPVGIEWSAIAKNIATLGFHARLAASGSLNLAGAYAGDLYGEVWEYATTLGATPRSFIGVAGVGDLLATSHADGSRNVRGGQLLGTGYSASEAEASIKQVVESFHTVPLLKHRTTRAHPQGTIPALSALSDLITQEK